MIGRPKSKDEILTDGLTITVTKTEKEKIEKLIKREKISMNQFFRDLLSEKFKEEKI